MFGKSRIGDSVAAEMDRILGDSEFQSVFSKPELTDDFSHALAQDSGYQAFVRVASKKDDDKEDDKDDKDQPPAWLRKKREDASGEDIYDDDHKPKKKKDDDKKKEAALALEFIVENLSKTSEALDNLGFDKSATVALALINGIYREATVKLADVGMDSRVQELSSQSPEDLVHDDSESSFDGPGNFSFMSNPNELPEDEDEGEEDEVDFSGVGSDGTPYTASPALADDEVDGDMAFGDDDMGFGDMGFGDDLDGDAGDCGMMASASDKSKDKDKDKAKKDCAAEAKKLMKKHGCKGTAKVTEKGVEVTCKGEKGMCDKCCKEIMAFCKKHKVSCKINKEYTDKKEDKKDKKAFVIRNRAVLAAMNELNDWLKEG